MVNTTTKPLLATLRELEIGHELTFPIERTSYIRSVCTSFGLQWGKTFKTVTNRAQRTITVSRTA